MQEPITRRSKGNGYIRTHHRIWNRIHSWDIPQVDSPICELCEERRRRLEPAAANTIMEKQKTKKQKLEKARKILKKQIEVKWKSKSGFTVVMKDNTPSKEVSQLMEEVLKNKYVKSLEGTINLE
jgi:hypothetical protein